MQFIPTAPRFAGPALKSAECTKVHGVSGSADGFFDQVAEATSAPMALDSGLGLTSAPMALHPGPGAKAGAEVGEEDSMPAGASEGFVPLAALGLIGSREAHYGAASRDGSVADVPATRERGAMAASSRAGGQAVGWAAPATGGQVIGVPGISVEVPTPVGRVLVRVEGDLAGQALGGRWIGPEPVEVPARQSGQAAQYGSGTAGDTGAAPKPPAAGAGYAGPWGSESSPPPSRREIPGVTIDRDRQAGRERRAGTSGRPALPWWLRAPAEAQVDREGGQPDPGAYTRGAPMRVPGGAGGERAADARAPRAERPDGARRPGNGGPEGGLSLRPTHGLTDEPATRPSRPRSIPARPATGGVSGASPVAAETAAAGAPQTGRFEGVRSPDLLPPKVAAVSSQASYWLRHTLRANQRQAVVTLDPPGLGRLIINLRQVSGVITARLTAERPEVEALLREGCDAIRERLNSQGLRVESVIVDTAPHRATPARPATVEGAGAHLQDPGGPGTGPQERQGDSPGSGRPATRERSGPAAEDPHDGSRAAANGPIPAQGTRRRRIGVDVRV